MISHRVTRFLTLAISLPLIFGPSAGLAAAASSTGTGGQATNSQEGQSGSAKNWHRKHQFKRKSTKSPHSKAISAHSKTCPKKGALSKRGHKRHPRLNGKGSGVGGQQLSRSN